jgi:hypothetical protein
MPAQLVSLIEAESLVNDGTAVVLFSLCVGDGHREGCFGAGSVRRSSPAYVLVPAARRSLADWQRQTKLNSRPLPWQGRLPILYSGGVE